MLGRAPEFPLNSKATHSCRDWTRHQRSTPSRQRHVDVHASKAKRKYAKPASPKPAPASQVTYPSTAPTSPKAAAALLMQSWNTGRCKHPCAPTDRQQQQRVHQETAEAGEGQESMYLLSVTNMVSDKSNMQMHGNLALSCRLLRQRQAKCRTSKHSGRASLILSSVQK